MTVRKKMQRSRRSRVSKTNGHVWRLVSAVKVCFRFCCESDNQVWLLYRFGKSTWEGKLHRHIGYKGEKISMLY